jgi:hypothetical protein
VSKQTSDIQIDIAFRHHILCSKTQSQHKPDDVASQILWFKNGHSVNASVSALPIIFFVACEHHVNTLTKMCEHTGHHGAQGLVNNNLALSIATRQAQCIIIGYMLLLRACKSHIIRNGMLISSSLSSWPHLTRRRDVAQSPSTKQEHHNQ